MLQNDEELNDERNRFDVKVCEAVLLAICTTNTRNAWEESALLHRNTDFTSSSSSWKQKPSSFHSLNSN